MAHKTSIVMGDSLINDYQNNKMTANVAMNDRQYGALMAFQNVDFDNLWRFGALFLIFK